MRYAILSDIHGNLDALDAVLSQVDSLGVNHLVCLGDIVGYGPQPEECLQRVLERDATFVAGNHDFAVTQRIDISNFNVNARAATLWTRKNLSADALHFLGSLPLVEELDGLTAVHGSLHAPELFDYVQSTYDAALCVEAMTQPLCCIGHSHVPLAFTQRDVLCYTLAQRIVVDKCGKTVVNVGSVGQPRDYDPRACFAIFDNLVGELTLERVPYDFEATGAKIRAAGLPHVLGDRLKLGR